MATDSKDRSINTASPEHYPDKLQPNERDESPDEHDQRPRGIIKQAAEDLAQGLVDTDMRGGDTGLEEVVQPAPGATGQANPQPDRAHDMHDRGSSGKKQ
ncbi:hypothetical protein [Massilia horti]|uniref:Uncharacterized protein n=1 Tax=Massilia horti TaxID=2562153 RepID=A0A4Y9SSF0_9BURK|nr:hypothetical protein [Massilia horti]TFW28111.1 hypothetical protein E4O92_22100 [Massilia horti]TFW28134.1 hypothetical protein E4O92_22215 [Massilia horti]